jgi:hypothetical protein
MEEKTLMAYLGCKLQRLICVARLKEADIDRDNQCISLCLLIEQIKNFSPLPFFTLNFSDVTMFDPCLQSQFHSHFTVKNQPLMVHFVLRGLIQ